MITPEETQDLPPAPVAEEHKRPESESAGHVWDETGERCTRCGDKDWFASSACDADKTPASAQVPEGWREAIQKVRDNICAGGDGVGRQMEYEAVTPYLDEIECLLGELAAPSVPVKPAVPDVDALAQHIRTIDGNNDMGAGALAESICNWIEEQKQ